LGMPLNSYITMARGAVPTAILTAKAHLDAGLATYAVIARSNKDFSHAQRSTESGELGRRHTLEKAGYWGKPLGDLRAMSHHTFFARRHMYEYGTTSEQLGSIAVAARGWAQGNPLAR